MIDNTVFYHNTIRKLVVAFGTLFNNIYVQRVDLNNAPSQLLKVPLSYGTKQKWLLRDIQNPDQRTYSRVEISLPRLAFETVSFQYDAARMNAPTTRTQFVKNSTTMVKTNSPAPYNVGFNLYILSRNLDDGLQILEQILPFFRPDYVITIKDLPEMNLTRDVPISIQGVSYEDTAEGSLQDTTLHIWTLNFNCKAEIYGPVSDTGVIKEVIANVWPNMPGYPSAGEKYDAQVNPITAQPTDTYTILESWTQLTP